MRGDEAARARHDAPSAGERTDAHDLITRLATTEPLHEALNEAEDAQSVERRIEQIGHRAIAGIVCVGVMLPMLFRAQQDAAPLQPVNQRRSLALRFVAPDMDLAGENAGGQGAEREGIDPAKEEKDGQECRAQGEVGTIARPEAGTGAVEWLGMVIDGRPVDMLAENGGLRIAISVDIPVYDPAHQVGEKNAQTDLCRDYRG